jgi:hypothetical protein
MRKNGVKKKILKEEKKKKKMKKEKKRPSGMSANILSAFQTLKGGSTGKGINIRG